MYQKGRGKYSSSPKTHQRLSPAETKPFRGAGRHRPTLGQNQPTMGGSIEPPINIYQTIN